jgi:hypothetical protein
LRINGTIAAMRALPIRVVTPAPASGSILAAASRIHPMVAGCQADGSYSKASLMTVQDACPENP